MNLIFQSRSARAVFQFYPENESQLDLLTSQAMKAGFYGGVVIDFPNSAKAKKFFLVLMTGGAAPLPKALGNIPFKIDLIVVQTRALNLISFILFIIRYRRRG